MDSSTLHPHGVRTLSGRPAEVTALDHHIATHGGTTFNIEKLLSRLQFSKTHPPQTQSKRIEELVRENSYLRQEIALYQETRGALMALHAKTIKAYELLQDGLQVLSQQVAQSEKRLLNYWGIDLDDEGMEVTVI